MNEILQRTNIKNFEKAFYYLSFGNLRFDAVVSLKANNPNKAFFKKFNDLPLLAADGAANGLFNKGIIPDFIIGDLDSFYKCPASNDFPKENLIYLPDQESNDFEKILVFAEKNKWKNLLIVGFHGGELEHTLNNWSVLMRFARKMSLCIYEHNRYGIPVQNSFTLQTKADEIISLIPQPQAILTTKNLKWELNNESLELGTREGARNIAISENISVFLHEGELLLFIDRRLPYAPEWAKK